MPARAIQFAVAVLIVWLCAVAPPSLADTWTNAAGHRLEAKLVGGNERTVVFELPGGSGTVRMALASLQASEQARALETLRRAGILPPVVAKAAPGAGLAQRAQRLQDAGDLDATQNARIQQALRPTPVEPAAGK